MKSNRRKFLRQFTIGAGSLASLPAFVKKDEEDIFTITLDKTHLQNVREKFPFLRDADDFRIITDRE